MFGYPYGSVSYGFFPNGKQIAVTITESLGLTETVIKLSHLSKTILESISLTELLSKISSLIKRIIDSLLLAEIVSKACGFAINIVNSIKLSELINILRGYIINVTEAIELTESKLIGTSKSIIEQVKLTETLSKKASFIKKINESTLVRAIIHIAGWLLLQVKSVTPWTQQSKATTSWTNQTKNISGSIIE
jgi:hypothetical protein